jgi:hypothetical protein
MPTIAELSSLMAAVAVMIESAVLRRVTLAPDAM